MAIPHEAADVSSLVMVPAVEWRTFLEQFGRRHRAWLATIHGVERGAPVTRIPSLALAAATLDGRGPDYVIRLTFGNGVSLCAPRPRAVRVQRTEHGAECALEIDTADDGFIRLAFRATALPEELDGAAPAEVMVKRPAHH
jgi:hypothetical protein